MQLMPWRRQKGAEVNGQAGGPDREESIRPEGGSNGEEMIRPV